MNIALLVFCTKSRQTGAKIKLALTNCTKILCLRKTIWSKNEAQKTDPFFQHVRAKITTQKPSTKLDVKISNFE